MAMHDQTPVQIAWATRHIDGTERALTVNEWAVSFFDYVKQEQV